MRVRWLLFCCFWIAVFAIPGSLPVAAQDELRLLDIDTSEFPTVHISLASRNAIGAPVADLSQLTLRENGAPVTDFTLEKVPTGVDLVFVLDANVGFEEVDDGEGGLSRREKVQDSIVRFSEIYMNAGGLDRVSIMVPGEDGESGSWLIQDASEPGQVAAAIEAYDPARLNPTPLNAMLLQALELMQQQPDSDRYRALLLFSDSRRLAEQLSYPIVTAVANDNNTPLYVAILGAAADEQEIDNAQRLFEPTRATYVHMPQATDTDAIYEIWQSQGEQLQLSYQSRQRQEGRSQVSINLGEAQVSGSFDITLQAPQVTLELESGEIRRVGATADAALTDLQPVIQSLPLRITWPDGLPRALRDAALSANGVPLTLLGTLPEGAASAFTLSWDIRDLDAGQYDLQLTVTDELDYRGTSEVVPVLITTERPPPATIMPVEPVVDLEDNNVNSDGPEAGLLGNLPWLGGDLAGLDGDLAAAVTGVFLVLVVAALWRRRGLSKSGQAQMAKETEPVIVGKVENDGEDLIAKLVPFGGVAAAEPVALAGDNITIGRSPEVASIVIQHPSVGHLHARVRKQLEAYWLFDEGSAEGTHLNYARLGLAPQKLQDGDVVQFGRVSYHFRLRPSTEPDEEPTVSPASDIGVILDMDGLMVDTEPLSRQAWDQVLVDLGYEPLTDAFYERLIGHRLWETAELVVAHYQLPMAASELAWRKEVRFAEIRNAGIPVMPGLHELLAALKQRQIPWAVATSSPHHMAEEVLAQIGVLDSCQAIAAGDDVPRGKPEPDVYLLAAERLNLPPQQCLGIEDSVPGCQSASAAGTLTIVVPNSEAMWDDFACADYVMTSLLDVVGRLDALQNELRQR